MILRERFESGGREILRERGMRVAGWRRIERGQRVAVRRY